MKEVTIERINEYLNGFIKLTLENLKKSPDNDYLKGNLFTAEDLKLFIEDNGSKVSNLSSMQISREWLED